jgi:hypothetical protein
LTFHADKYVKKLFGIYRVEDAFQRLDKLTQDGVRMAEVEILTIAARMDETLIHVGENVEGVNEEMGHVDQSRKALRQWIDPPDRSSNFYAASDAHHEGTTAWCIEGKTFAEWMVSGSLLWIHGKRNYTIAAVLIVTNDSWVDSWLWEDYSQVRYPPC